MKKILSLVLILFITVPLNPQSATDGTGGIAASQAWNEELFVGNDLGARINQAITQLPVYTDKNGQVWPIGWIRIPFGTYTYTTAIKINSPFVSLWADPGTTMFWNNNTPEAIRIQQIPQSTGSHYLQPSQATQLWNIDLVNINSGGQSGIHQSDESGVGYHNVNVSGFNDNGSCTGVAGPANSAFWFDNINGNSEELDLDHVSTYDNCIGARFTAEFGPGGTNSFAYAEMRHSFFGIRANEIGVSIENGTFVYGASWQFVTEANNGSATGMSITGNGTFGGVPGQQGGDNWISWRMECVACPGGTPATQLYEASTGTFRAAGTLVGLNGTTVNNTAGTFVMSGTMAPITSLNFAEWYGDGGWRMYYNNFVGSVQYAGNWRLAGGTTITNVGWSVSPGPTANYLSISPISNGVPTLCVNQGVVGLCTGNIRIAGLQGQSPQQFVQSVGTLNTPANGIGVPVEGGQVDLLAQTASITATSLISEPTSPGGGTTMAQIEAECNLIPYSGSGSATVTLSYQDQHSHTQSITSSSASGTAQQTLQWLATPTLNTAVTYAVAVTGTLSYDLHCNGKQVSF